MENKNFKPTVFWAWNGAMEEEKIRAQIAGFAAAGIGGLHIHARAGLTIEYLGEEWFRAFAVSIEVCKQYAIDLWIYDEQGWPSGFAGGKVNALGEDYCLKFLNRATEYGYEFADRILAAYRRTENGYERVPVHPRADLYVYYDTQEHYVDLLNPAVSRAFLNYTHEEYKRRFSEEFGKTIRGVFTDEPQIHVSSRAWSVAISERFRAKYGEDVLDGLYLLFEEEGEGYQTFRYRYYAAVRELFLENYTRPIAEWCEENHLILTGHFAGEEGLCVQVASNTGVMPHYEYMRQPGIDHLGRKLNPVLLLKQVQSVANQFGKERILTELYACTGNGVGFADLAWIWNYQAAFGVNMPCMSISMYQLGGVRKRDYPVFVSAQQPWWPEFAAFAAFLKHSSEFVSEGNFYPRVLLLSATESALEEPIFSLKQKNVSARYRRLAEDLVRLQIPYDIGDELLLAKYGRVEKNKLRLQQGAYEIVIMPELDNITASTVKLLREFADCGGKIVCMTRLPRRVDGQPDEERFVQTQLDGIDIIQQRLGILEKYFDSLGFTRKICVRDGMGKLIRDLVCSYRDTETGANIVLFNPSVSSAVRGKLCAEGAGRFLYYHPDTGTEEEAAAVCAKGFTYTNVSLCAKAAAYYRFVRDERVSENVCELLSTEETPFYLKQVDENILTIDFARYKFEDEPYSASMPLVAIADELYDRAEKYGRACRAEIEYSFHCLERVGPIAFVAETEKVRKLTVNGIEIPCTTSEYFLDEDFRRYDISETVRVGENTAVVAIEIEPLRLGFDLKQAHDAVRNKFSYPVAAESAYLVGDFSVLPLGEVTENINHIRAEGGFALAAPRPLPDRGDLTRHGLWFYAGNAEYELHVCRKNGRTFLHLAEYFGAAAKIYVNGGTAGTIFLPESMLELTQYLQEGDNTVSIVLSGTLRNMLGPHHHFKGETEYTGIHTYTGEYGNGAIEDLSSEEAPDAIWTDSYSMIRFGLGSVEIINRKNQNGGK